MQSPCVEVLIDNASLSSTVCGALERIGAEVVVRHFAPQLRPRKSRRPHARLFLTADRAAMTEGKLPALLKYCEADPCATLILGPEGADGDAVAPALGEAAIDVAGELTVEDLSGRLSAMCRLHPSLSRLHDQLDDVRRKEADAFLKLQQLEDQVRLARQIQQDLLPDALPRIDGLEVDVWYAPAQTISGDIYDVYRLDETRVAFALADATGHGVPAALLSVLIKRSLDARRLEFAPGEPVDPAAVLRRLNDDTCGLALSQCQFVAALFAVYDERTRELCWARGGHPYPILLSPGGPARQIVTQGSLLGVLRDPDFETTRLQLNEGDVVIFHTDGLDDLVGTRPGRPGRDPLPSTAWYRSLSARSAAAGIDTLKTLRQANPRGTDLDDITLLALKARG